MDLFWCRNKETQCRSVVFECGSTLETAIRECDRKARAWDELEKWTKERDWTSTGASYIRTFQLKMAELLSPPKPKSVYDKVRNMARHMTFNGTIVTNLFLKKIDRMEAEDE